MKQPEHHSKVGKTNVDIMYIPKGSKISSPASLGTSHQQSWCNQSYKLTELQYLPQFQPVLSVLPVAPKYNF